MGEMRGEGQCGGMEGKGGRGESGICLMTGHSALWGHHLRLPRSLDWARGWKVHVNGVGDDVMHRGPPSPHCGLALLYAYGVNDRFCVDDAPASSPTLTVSVPSLHGLTENLHPVSGCCPFGQWPLQTLSTASQALQAVNSISEMSLHLPSSLYSCCYQAGLWHLSPG